MAERWAKCCYYPMHDGEDGVMERDHQPDSLLAQLAQTYTALMRTFADQVGMSPTRLEILRELLHEPELDQATLQKRLQIDAAALTRHVQQLEREGLIQRRINPQHHRLLLLTLTEAGRQSLAQLQAVRARFEEQLFVGISAEEQQVARQVLTHIQGNLHTLMAEREARR